MAKTKDPLSEPAAADTRLEDLIAAKVAAGLDLQTATEVAMRQIATDDARAAQEEPATPPEA